MMIVIDNVKNETVVMVVILLIVLTVKAKYWNDDVTMTVVTKRNDDIDVIVLKNDSN